MSSYRGRSLAGCGTCRMRHVKCDENRPECRVCLEFGSDCQGYQARLVFITPGEPKLQQYDGSQFRRPIFTEQQRLGMSDALKQSLFPLSPSQALAEIDEQSQGLCTSSSPENVNLNHGPFSVFRPLSQPVSEEETVTVQISPSASSLSDSGTSANLVDNVNSECLATAAVTSVQSRSDDDSNQRPAEIHDQLSTSNDLINMVLEDMGSSSSSMCHTNGYAQNDNLHILGGVYDVDMDHSPPVVSERRDWGGEPPGLFDINTPEPRNHQQHCIPNPEARLSWSLLPYQSSLAPEDSAFLLAHYRDHVISLLTPLKYHRKTPWYILQLPCAMHTLAELTMGTKSNAACSALFYGLLSVSAFSIYATQSSNLVHWKDTGQRYQKRAHEFLKYSLINETSGIKVAKYKEVLMALLTMVTISAFGGATENTRTYLLDAEKLIRLKGLAKPKKSRKIRLLHHCYAYLRIMYESTAVGANHSPPRNEILTQSSSAFQPSSLFRFSNRSTNFERALAKDKDTELGQNDIHLEVPGRWLQTLYPAIYGIPELFMCLLSQATRLANEREAMRLHPEGANLTTEEFVRCSKDIETQICQWKPSSSQYPDGHDASVNLALVDSNRRIVNAMLHAMHEALIVFFYRRVHDVNPLILQTHVENTISHLEASSLEDAISGGYTVAIVWPGFISACEALSPNLQQRFQAWFDASEQGSGIPTFNVVRNLAKQVWDKRNQAGNHNFNWMDLMREQNISILCT